MAAGGSAAAATGATASPRRLPWHHAGRCFGGEPAQWWVNTVVDHFADMGAKLLQGAGPDQAAQPGVAPRPPQALPRAALHLRRGCAAAAPLPACMHACLVCLPASTASTAWQACPCERGNLGAALPACSAGQSNAAPACAASQPAPHAMWLGRPLSRSRHCHCGGPDSTLLQHIHPPSCRLAHLPCPAEASPEEFFVPYVWSLAVAQAGIPWRLSAITLFTPTGPPRLNSACACLRCTSTAGDTVQCLCMSALRCTYWRPTMWVVP